MLVKPDKILIAYALDCIKQNADIIAVVFFFFFGFSFHDPPLLQQNRSLHFNPVNIRAIYI